MMQSFSYKTLLIIVFLLLSLGGIGGVLYNAYSSTAKAVFGLSEQLLTHLSERVVHRAVGEVRHIESYLYANAALIASTPDILADRDRLLPVFWQQLRHNNAVRSVYVADTRGDMVQVHQAPRLLTRVIDRRGDGGVESITYRSPAYEPIAHSDKATDYDPRRRPWFKGSVAGKVVWSPVYDFAFGLHDGAPPLRGVTASLAIGDSVDPHRYVVAADVTLGGIADFLSEQEVADEVAVFVVDGQDRLIAYPYQLGLDQPLDDPNTRLPQVDALPQDWIRQAYAVYRAAGSPTGQTIVTKTGGETYFTNAISLDPSIENAWRVVVIAPNAYLLRSATGILRQSMTLSLILVLASLFVIYWVASYLSSPIRQLAANAGRIERFRFEDVQPLTHRWCDIRDLDDSLAHICAQLQTLAKFVPRELRDRWLRDDQPIRLGARVHDLDLLVSQLGDGPGLLYRLSEQHQDRLAAHCQTVSDIIHDRRGTIDHYTGDGLRAFWGAPATVKGGTERACDCALLAAAAEDQAASDADEPPLRSNFAVHSGRSLAGNFGSEQRMSYTTLGATAFVASELLDLNRRYGTRVIISEASYRQVAGRFRVRPLDRVRLDHDQPAQTLYELVAVQGTELALARKQFIDAYTIAFECYGRQAWVDALDALAKVPPAYRDDRSVRLLDCRCRRLAEGAAPPLPDDWDGAWPEPETPPC